MADWTIVQDFIEKLGDETHDLTADTFKVAASNTAILATNSTLSAITEIAAGNGYTAGGATATVSYAESGGTGTLTLDSDLVITASGGAIATFRYLYFYNDTAANDEGICFFDYGAAVDLASGESFTITAGTILTIAIA